MCSSGGVCLPVGVHLLAGGRQVLCRRNVWDQRLLRRAPEAWPVQPGFTGEPKSQKHSAFQLGLTLQSELSPGPSAGVSHKEATVGSGAGRDVALDFHGLYGHRVLGWCPLPVPYAHTAKPSSRPGVVGAPSPPPLFHLAKGRWDRVPHPLHLCYATLLCPLTQNQGLGRKQMTDSRGHLQEEVK